MKTTSKIRPIDDYNDDYDE